MKYSTTIKSFIAVFIYFIFTQPVFSEVFTKNGNNRTVSCNTFCEGDRWGAIGDIGSCVPPAIDTENNNKKVSCNFKGSVGSQLTCKCNRNLFINFPINEKEHTELGDHRRMASEAKLSNNGRLDVSTKTWTDKKNKGFTGGISVFFLDRDGNVLGASNVHKYGVNGKNLPGPSKRTDRWNMNIPSSILKKISRLEIKHAHTPKEVWTLIRKHISDVCGTAKMVTSTGEYCP